MTEAFPKHCNFCRNAEFTHWLTNAVVLLPSGWSIRVKSLNEMKIKSMRAGGFTLVEVMIVVAIIGLLIAVAVPNFKRSINKSRTIACHTQLQNIDASKMQWSVEEKRSDADVPSESQIGVFFRDGFPVCPAGGAYTIASVGQKATCSVHGTVGQDATGQ